MRAILRNKVKYPLLVALIALCGIAWRMGGAEGYDKLWRRLGSSACMILGVIILSQDIIWWKHLIAYAMIFYGSWSYFGWLTPGDKKERWFNFLAAALLTQFSVIVLSFTWVGFALAVVFALAGALGKVAIDKSGLKHQDVKSEIYYGSMMSAGVIINLIVTFK